MLTILFWAMGIALGIYLLGVFLFAGLMMTCLVGGYRSWPEVKELLLWVLIWPSWVPRAVWYLWGNDLMMDC